IKRALAKNCGVVVLNFNEKCLGEENWCHGRYMHAQEEWRHALNEAPHSDIVVVAHSDVEWIIFDLVRRMLLANANDDRVLAVALAESRFSEGRNVFANNWTAMKMMLRRRDTVWHLHSGDHKYEGAAVSCLNACFTVLEGVGCDTTIDEFNELLLAGKKIIDEEYKEKKREELNLIQGRIEELENNFKNDCFVFTTDRGMRIQVPETSNEKQQVDEMKEPMNQGGIASDYDRVLSLTPSLLAQKSILRERAGHNSSGARAPPIRLALLGNDQNPVRRANSPSLDEPPFTHAVLAVSSNSPSLPAPIRPPKSIDYGLNFWDNLIAGKHPPNLSGAGRLPCREKGLLHWWSLLLGRPILIDEVVSIRQTEHPAA
ncbi:hypothetical protein PMAYCL1PPCAC_10369, partial [Pristionchus mayeri]